MRAALAVLLGAVMLYPPLTTPSPRIHAAARAHAAAPVLQALRAEVRQARLTAYAWTGQVMYSGQYPGAGDAACSWDIPLGSTVTLLDGPLAGNEYLCEDRGPLGAGAPEDWIDLYAGTDDAAWALMALYPDQQVSIAVSSWSDAVP
jgi:hypothetical protein